MERENAKTIGEIVIKTATSVIPIGGTLISCVIDEIKSNSMQKRQDEWMSLIEERLAKIELNLQTIGNNRKGILCGFENSTEECLIKEDVPFLILSVI